MLLQKCISKQIKVSSLSNKIITMLEQNWEWESVDAPTLQQLPEVCIILELIYL